MFVYLLCALCIALYLLRRKYLSRVRELRECANKIPGPKPLPIIGNALEFGISSKSIFNNSNRLVRQYGPYVRIWLGSHLVVICTDPDCIKLLLGSMNHLSKASFYKFAEPWVGRGLFTSTGDIWKLHRKIIAPTFNGQRLTKFLSVYNSNLDALIQKMSQYQNGSSFDIFRIMSLFALDVICESAMGVKVNTLLNEDSRYFKAVNCVEEVLFNRIFRPWLYPNITFRVSSSGRRLAKHLLTLKDMTRRVLEQRKQQRAAEPATKIEKNYVDDEEEKKDGSSLSTECVKKGIKKRPAFLDELLCQVEKGANISNEEIQDEVNSMIVAGHDTTAINLSIICWLLAKHQDVQEKVVEELRSIFGSSLRQAESQDLNKMTYTEQVVKESLRLFPSVPVIARRLTEDLVTDKYVIPAGSEVAVRLYMLHRHPQYFPDPETFDPDRFLPENCAGRHPYAYIPFSAGPRNCVGYKFAMLEIKATLATLLRHFKILPPENPFQVLDIAEQLLIKPIDGVPIKLQASNFLKQNNHV